MLLDQVSFLTRCKKVDFFPVFGRKKNFFYVFKQQSRLFRRLAIESVAFTCLSKAAGQAKAEMAAQREKQEKKGGKGVKKGVKSTRYRSFEVLKRVLKTPKIDPQGVKKRSPRSSFASRRGPQRFNLKMSSRTPVPQPPPSSISNAPVCPACTKKVAKPNQYCSATCERNARSDAADDAILRNLKK